MTLIAALSKDGCIGKEGALPWNVPGDLKRFRALTIGKPVIMGRVTWDSLPRRPLAGRLNIVLSRRAAAFPGAVHASSLDEALLLARESGATEACVIGGDQVYRAAIPFANRLELSEIDVVISGGDAFFPYFHPSGWRTIAEERIPGNPSWTARSLVRS